MSAEELLEHLSSGATTVARVWRVTRTDGVALGFTDHDRDIDIDGFSHRAGSGLTARAFQNVSGLAVDNTEVVGALSHLALREEDLSAGRYDGARVEVWLVNWAAPEMRRTIFRGTLGEVSWKGSEFRAELRGLSEPLGDPVGFAYTRQCSAVLGDSRCGFNVLQPGYFLEHSIERVEDDGRVLRFASLAGYESRWFEGGRLDVLSGAAVGLSAMIKVDRVTPQGRRVELWQSIRAQLEAGDQIRLLAGCNKTAETCRMKFANFVNFRGFPFIPGDDWISAYPKPGQPVDGGSGFQGPLAPGG